MLKFSRTRFEPSEGFSYLWVRTQSAACFFRIWLSGLSLALQFAAAAFIVLAAAMTVLGFWISSRIERGVVQNTAMSTAFYMESLIEPLLQPLATQNTVPQDVADALDGIIKSPSLARSVAFIKVWALDGTILYSNNRQIIGKRFPQARSFLMAKSGSVVAEFDDLTEEGDSFERAFGKPLLEIYSPVHENGTDRVIAVCEIYQLGDGLRADIVRIRGSTVLLAGSLTFAMLALLYKLVQKGSRTIIRQRAALEQRIGQLALLLEQNESLREKIVAARKRAADTNERLMRRIGADLHDGPAQHVALALLLLDRLSPANSAKDDPAQSQAFDTIQCVLTDALSEIRTLSAGIAPPELQDLSLANLIELAASNHEKRTGTKVNRDIGELPQDVPSSIKTALYRLAQEGLTNAFRHAGGMGQTIVAAFQEERIDVEIIDSGPGIEMNSKPSQSALGLAGLRDRIESLGGQFEIKTAPGAGTRIVSRFVLNKDALSHV